jgi:uronate dehydrogenase
VRAAVDGVDAVIHLAGIATEAPFADVLSVNVAGTQNLLRAATEAGVRRVLVASSNHAVGFTPRMPLAPVDLPLRPDTFYGWSKAAVESLCRLYVDREGLQIACLRIGSCYPRPSTVRQLSTWLSPADCTRMMDACLRTDRLGFATIYGISANTRGWWDLAPGRELGFDPCDDAERYAAELIAEHGELDPDAAWLGGEFTRPRG